VCENSPNMFQQPHSPPYPKPVYHGILKNSNPQSIHSILPARPIRQRDTPSNPYIPFYIILEFEPQRQEVEFCIERISF
jgi:hypothetical protein